MIFNNIIEGKLIKRYKRFFVDCQLLNGDIITAYCPNTGSMKSLLKKGNKVFLTFEDNPKRKLKYTLQAMETNSKSLAFVNTQLVNSLVRESIENNKIKFLKDYKKLKAEVRYGKENSRIDFFLIDSDDFEIYLEVKNVTLVDENNDSMAIFPDAVSKRGSKHLRELSFQAQKDSVKSVIFYVVNRLDCDSFGIARDIDPNYDYEFKKAMKNGVVSLVYKTKIIFKDNDMVVEIDKKID